MVKDRRGGGVGVGDMKKEEVEGDYRTLCSHTNACVNTHIQAYTLAFTDILYVHMKAHTQF